MMPRDHRYYWLIGYGQAVSGELDGAQEALGGVSGKVLTTYH
jgi:hypothetical protein